MLLRSAAEGGDLTPLVHDEATAGMEKTTLKGADMTGAKVAANLIVQTDLTDCILKNASFKGANLSMSNLTGCDLEGADFSDANLSGAIFHGAVFAATTLDNADLSGADMIGAMFENMDFSKVNLDAAHIAKTLGDLDIEIKEVIIKHGEWVKTNGKEGERADLSKMDLSGESL